jgi:hypothetical protein
MSVKNSSDTIGNRTRDLPACSAVPQPTAPPRAPYPVCTYNFCVSYMFLFQYQKRQRKCKYVRKYIRVVAHMYGGHVSASDLQVYRSSTIFGCEWNPRYVWHIWGKQNLENCVRQTSFKSSYVIFWRWIKQAQSCALWRTVVLSVSCYYTTKVSRHYSYPCNGHNTSPHEECKPIKYEVTYTNTEASLCCYVPGINNTSANPLQKSFWSPEHVNTWPEQ